MENLAKWTPCELPGNIELMGAYAHLEPLNWERHSAGLFAAICGPDNDDLWHYIPAGPFETTAQFRANLKIAEDDHSWKIMVIRCTQTTEILGIACYMRNRPEHGSTEVGSIIFAKKLQRSRIATDAMYLMAKHVFGDLGYRRYEWKCNNDNEPSKRAANRFGFTFEGVFRNDMVLKGKNRDTAWFTILDSEWPAVEAAFTAWLNPDNFDANGQQHRKLESLR